MCRISVVATGRRMDVSLPVNVPVAVLLPALARLARLPVGPAGDSRLTGWGLAPLGGAPLASTTTLGQAGVLTGDVLVMARNDVATAPPVITDLVEVAQADVDESTDRLDARTAGRLLRWGASGFALLAAPLLAAGRPVSGLAVALCCTTALVLLGSVRLVPRASPARLICAHLGIEYVGVGAVGCASMGAIEVPGQILAGALAVVAAAVLSVPLVGLERPHPATVALGTAALATAVPAAVVIAAHVRTASGTAATLAAAVFVLIMLTAVLPDLVLRGTGFTSALVGPGAGPGHRGGAAHPGPGEVAAAREMLSLAHRTLASLLAGIAAAVAIGLIAVVVCNPGLLGELFVAAASVALLLRSRTARLRSEVLPLVLAATVGLVAFEVTVVSGIGNEVLRFAVFAVTGLFLLGLAQTATGSGYRWDQALGVTEIVVLAAMVPLVLGLLGLFGTVEDFTARVGSG
ncbi:EsaB/YukD family protein [Frankia sp. R82]|uniref:EsaB/YukD family protein n=1 Tax=Frankia sp. R82 TaxID=2950553 RepID=UPI002042E9B2|nr:EsaB/YukD family protein [Frankia sp. R82]MCM3883414.1 EsaB/YukD family protein [Frankia sp. R82]